MKLYNTNHVKKEGRIVTAVESSSVPTKAVSDDDNIAIHCHQSQHENRNKHIYKRHLNNGYKKNYIKRLLLRKTEL